MIRKITKHKFLKNSPTEGFKEILRKEIQARRDSQKEIFNFVYDKLQKSKFVISPDKLPYKSILSAANFSKLRFNVETERLRKYIETSPPEEVSKLVDFYQNCEKLNSPFAHFYLIKWVIGERCLECPVCKWMAKQSPWTNKKLPILPKQGICGVGFSCDCTLDITIGSTIKVQEAEEKLPDNIQINNVIHKQKR